MQEVLLYEIFIKSDIVYICIPGHNLTNLNYKLNGNSLAISVNNSSNTVYVINNLNDYIISKINNGKAVLVEKLKYNNQIHHLIKISP